MLNCINYNDPIIQEIIEGYRNYIKMKIDLNKEIDCYISVFNDGMITHWELLDIMLEFNDRKNELKRYFNDLMKLGLNRKISVLDINTSDIE